MIKFEYLSKFESHESFEQQLEKKLNDLPPKATIISISHTNNSNGHVSSVLIIYRLPS